MVKGVRIRMEKRVSLTTVALLSLLWEKDKRDYLDVLSQFVLRCLPQNIGVEINIETVKATLRTEYGFEDIPRHVVEKILSRLCKEKLNSKRYIRRERQRFYTENAFDYKPFDAAIVNTRTDISSVLGSLSEYLEHHYLHKKIELDEAADFLFNFFDSYGLTVVEDSNLLRAITTANGENNFYVARFILEQMDQETLISKRLIEITKGFLIYKAVYFYTTEMKSSIESKLRGVTFYLDCSLIIDALGYDSEGDESAFDEMCQLIRMNGGRIHVFDHTVEEAGNLLEAYANNPERRNAFSFPGLEKLTLPSEVLFSLAQPRSIKENLLKKQIKSCDIPSYDGIHGHHDCVRYYGFQDEKVIEQKLLQYSKKKTQSAYSSRLHSSNGSRYYYDAKSLSAIGRLRKDNHPMHIEKSVAIIVTQDYKLCSCMHDLYPSQFPSEIGFAIKDLDLVSVLWLSQYNKESQLPMNLLIANAVAACSISPEVMSQAINLAGKMESNKTISPEAALLIRSASAIRPHVFNRTRNNPANLTEDAIKDIIASYVKEEAKEDAEIAVKHAVESKEAELNAQHRKEIDSLTRRIDSISGEQRIKTVNMRRDAENIANKWATVAKNSVRFLIFIVSLGLLGLSIFCWWRGGFNTTNISAIILSFLGLFQICDFFIKFIDVSGRLSGIVRDKVFIWVHKHEIERREKLTHEKLLF